MRLCKTNQAPSIEDEVTTGRVTLGNFLYPVHLLPPGRTTLVSTSSRSVLAMNAARCVYALPRDLEALDQLPSNKGRSTAVHNLVESFGLLSPKGGRLAKTHEENHVNLARVVRTQPASREDLVQFHDPEYVDSLLQGHGIADHEDNEDDGTGSDDSHPRRANDQKFELFGLEHDCPPFPQMAQYVLAVAGASREISQELREDRADIGIVWDGGRHHAQPSCAAGFCYVNDIALAISELRKPPTDQTVKKLDRILYLDILDIHHGDAVELAYLSTSKVLTVSVHLHDPEGGFYPLSGSVESSGPAPPSPAASHALNIPIKHPGSLRTACHRVVLPLISAYKPSALVIQCGVDGLAGDPIGGRLWGMGLEEMGDCVGAVIQESLALGQKILLLGGGGYHTPNVARAWTYFTSVALGRKLSLDVEIPLGVKNEVTYGPTYTLDVPQLEKPGCKNGGGANSREGDDVECDDKLNEVLTKIEYHLSVIKNKYLNC